MTAGGRGLGGTLSVRIEFRNGPLEREACLNPKGTLVENAGAETGVVASTSGADNGAANRGDPTALKGGTGTRTGAEEGPANASE